MRGVDAHMDYEYLGRYVFNCHYKGCDPFHVASADRGYGYFSGSIDGKKSMSIIISRLVFEAEQRGKEQLIEPLKELYDQLWDLEDNSSVRTGINTSEPQRIMYELMDLAKEIIEREAAFF